MSTVEITPFSASTTSRLALDNPVVYRWVRTALQLWSLFLIMHGVNTGVLFRTENLRALSAEEMLRSGNWLIPHRYNQPLLTKPPLMYAAIALFSLPFGGVTAWTARIPSALSAGLAMFLFSRHCRRRLGRTGELAAILVLPMSFLWLEKVPTAEIDAVQMMWVTAALVCLFRALDESETPGARTEQMWWLASLLCVAGGFLTKWTAPAFFYMTAVPLLFLRGRLRLLWRRRHLLALGVAGCICLGWITLVVLQAGGGSFVHTVGREGLMRVSPVHHDRAYPWKEVLLHPFKLWGAAMPWSLVALWVLRRKFRSALDERGQRFLQEMHCWVWPSLLFWSIIPDHATRHSFPLFPGIAGLAVLVLTCWWTGRVSWPVRKVSLTGVLIAAVVVWTGAKIVFADVVVPRRNQERDPIGKAERLAQLVPEDCPLYLFRSNEEGLEGVMFYFLRTRGERLRNPIRNVGDIDALPWSNEPLYCIVNESTWAEWPPSTPAEVLHRFRSDLNEPMLLVVAKQGER